MFRPIEPRGPVGRGGLAQPGQHVHLVAVEAAEGEHPAAPVRLQCRCGGRGVGRREHEGPLVREEPAGPLFRELRSFVLIGETGAEDAVDPSFEEGGGASPPVGVDEHEAGAGLQLVAVGLDRRLEAVSAAQLAGREDGVEALGVEVVEAHDVAQGGEGLAGAFRHSVAEAPSLGMAQDNKGFHGQRV